MQCTNNLKQIGLAWHNMHDTYGHFPSACCQKELCADLLRPIGKCNFRSMQTTGGNRNIWHNRGRVSWPAAILPFVEQNGRYDVVQLWCSRANSPTATTDGGYGVVLTCQYEETFSYTGSVTAWQGTYENPFKGAITPFQCPSDSIKNVSTAFGLQQGQSYRGCMGDERYYYTENIGPYSGAYPSSLEPTDNNTFPCRGVCSNGLYEDVSVASIEDGTSNTIFLSEAAKASTDHLVGATASIRGGAAQISSSTLNNGFMATCLAKKNGTELLNAVPSAMGGRFADAYNIYTVFNTFLPPNSPNCFNNASMNENVGTTPSSYHSGGVNCGMGDGSVRFVSETVNCLSSDYTAANAPVRYVKGNSPYGVWGALGSRSGGENTSL